MAPKNEEPEATDERSRADARYPQNPAVLRAALEIVKRKKAEAIEKEEYEVAARFHQKLQELEGQLRNAEESGESGAAIPGLSEGDDDSSSEPRPSGSAEERRGSSALRPRSLFAAPNPFRTVELLRQSGYSRFQAYALLGLLYIAVFALEVLLLYAGWSLWGQSSLSGGEDGGEETFDDF
mmetsp:Transcript_4479/g.8122  ORF Transcript_4479/g.8122 Transcript_4479/m.8122 type:complete len:181 (-) Transcript_4479:87-629(-)